MTTLADNLKGDISRIDTDIIRETINTINGFGSTSTVSDINSITNNKIAITNELTRLLNIINRLKEV